jgi:hypothetical protein
LQPAWACCAVSAQPARAMAAAIGLIQCLIVVPL